MSALHNILIFLLTSAAYSYRLQCPVISQRQLRGSGYCRFKSEYSCLYDTNRLWFSELCDKNADYVTPGEKYVITGNLRNVDCSSERYQPFSLWSNVSGDCLYQKSLCEGEGQVIFNKGSLISDLTCQCDFRKGYKFIRRPKQKCFCIPSEEDCSCYISKGAGDSILSDSGCAEDKQQHDSTYPPTENERLLTTKHNTIMRNRITEKRKRKEITIPWIVIIAGALLIIGFLVIVFVVYWNEKRKSTNKTAFQHIEVLNAIKNLIQAGGDVSVSDDKNRPFLLYACSALHFSNSNKIPCTEKKIAAINQRNDRKFCSKRCTAVIRVLLDNKADVNMVDNRGVTPLMLACQAKCSQSVYLLLKYNAKINLTDNMNNSTALVWAMLEHPDVHMLNVIKMLING